MRDVVDNSNMSNSDSGDEVSLASITRELESDDFVKVAGIDTDGILRGKILEKEKFLSSAIDGFGMSSAIYGWDMHDDLYNFNTDITSEEKGFSDFLAIPDLRSFRRIPWEDNIPFFLLSFISEGKPVNADGRSLLRKVVDDLKKEGLTAKAGTELEFHNFQTPSEEGYTSGRRDIATYLEDNAPSSLRTITSGMFSYSITRPAMNKDYFFALYRTSTKFGCQLEALHSESGPGVFEAAIKYTDIAEAADRVTLFKYLAKSIGQQHRITPCFMAKPLYGMPGNSGHIHMSLVDSNGKDVFARKTRDDNAQYPDLAYLSDVGRQFCAGLLDALPDIMPLFAPTINSYKRVVENYWAPITVSWGLEDRMSSIRLIGPPISKAEATRFEIRIPGADLHPHYAMSALLGAGLRGIRKQLKLDIPPTSSRRKDNPPAVLHDTLDAAVKRFKAKDSIARELFDDEFVDFFAKTREHEVKQWKEAVTDWEFKRYVELV